MEIAHDGDGQAGTNASPRSPRRQAANLSFAWGTKIAAADGVTVSHAQNALFLNGPVPKGARPRRLPSIQIGDFGLGTIRQHPLAAQIKPIGFVQPKGLVFRFADSTMSPTSASRSPMKPARGTCGPQRLASLVRDQQTRRLLPPQTSTSPFALTGAR